jgi:hypothetical protein
MLKVHFEKYFCDDFDEFNWIKNPFENVPGPASLNVNEQEQLIDLTSDTSLKSKYIYIYIYIYTYLVPQESV